MEYTQIGLQAFHSSLLCRATLNIVGSKSAEAFNTASKGQIDVPADGRILLA